MTTAQALEIARLAEADRRLLETCGPSPAVDIALIWIDRAWALIAQIEALEEGER